MLSPENRRTLQGLLAARAHDLESMMHADSSRDDAGPSDVIDRKDLADRVATNEVHDAAAARAAAELREVAAAQERLRAGTYGRCIDCEADIDLRRLMLEPATPRCIECARQLEQQPRVESHGRSS